MRMQLENQNILSVQWMFCLSKEEDFFWEKHNHLLLANIFSPFSDGPVGINDLQKDAFHITVTTTSTSEKQPGFLSVSKLGLKWAMMTQGRMVWLKDSTTPKISRGEVRRFLARLKFVDFPHKVRLCTNLWWNPSCSGHLISFVQTHLGALYEARFILTARWSPAPLGISWPEYEAKLYFWQLDKERDLKKNQGW